VQFRGDGPAASKEVEQTLARVVPDGHGVEAAGPVGEVELPAGRHGLVPVEVVAGRRHRERDVVAGLGEEHVPTRHRVERREDVGPPQDVHLAPADGDAVAGADGVALADLRVEGVSVVTECPLVDAGHRYHCRWPVAALGGASVRS
jgi:hypothetical protein